MNELSTEPEGNVSPCPAFAERRLNAPFSRRCSS